MEDLLKAIQIFLKYGNPDYPTICDHDILYINEDINPDDVSEEDIAELKKLGFSVMDGQFYSYKFGSA